MEYTISRDASGNEVTSWNYLSIGHGDMAECHAEPPTCGCRPEGLCEAVDTVSDADFGYWNSGWGDPGVQEFPCSEPATTTVRDDWDGSPVQVCERHAR